VDKQAEKAEFTFLQNKSGIDKHAGIGLLLKMQRLLILPTVFGGQHWPNWKVVGVGYQILYSKKRIKCKKIVHFSRNMV